MSDGMHFGWSSPAKKYLQSNESHIEGYTPHLDTISQVLFLVAGVAFSPLISYLMDKIGRKWTNVAGSAVNLCSWAIIGFTNIPEMICFAHALASIAYTCDMVTMPVYVSEISNKEIRGFLLGYILLSAMFGIITIYVLFPLVNMWVSSGVGVGLHVIHISVLCFLPESPYFFIKKGKIEKGTKVLQFFRGNENIDEEFKEIQNEIELRTLKKGKVVDIVKDLSSRKALIIGCVLYIVVPIHCLSAVTMNLHAILGEELVLLSKDHVAISFAVTLFCAQVVCMFIVDKFGRKPLLLVSMIACELSLLIFATFYVLDKLYPEAMEPKSIRWIPEVVICLFAWFYRFGLGSIPTALCAELFPINHKAAGMAITFVTMTLVDGLVVFIYGVFSEAIENNTLPFFLFIGIGVFAVPFVIFIVPETKNKSLEEIQRVLRDEKMIVVDVKTLRKGEKGRKNEPTTSI